MIHACGHRSLLDRRVAIIGAGHVGSTAAFALMLDGTCRSIALIDRDKDRAEGEAYDLQHCMQFTQSTTIEGGDSFELVRGASVIVIAAGRAQTPGGETRDALLRDNAAMMADCIPRIMAVNRDAIILVVTNPVDAMTFYAWKLSGLSACRVFGTGTVLDTARLRYLLGNYCHVSPKDISAYILGEHGDSSFAWWSSATIGGVSIDAFVDEQVELRQSLLDRTRQAAYQVIDKKGSTSYSIAMVIMKIIRALLLDQSRVFTVSTCHDDQAGESFAMSVPTIVRSGGVCSQLPIVLNDQEKILYHASRAAIITQIAQLPS